MEVFGEEQLIEMGCGGILGVNLGSVDEPRLIKLSYRPESPTGHLGLVGKGIMYDSGGISLKPSDESHAQMKNDMTGAAAILGAMTALQDLGCAAAVTAYLCCTDNMPSGSAMKLGDVLRMRNGTTVEVLNTDAEGRLVMADGLCLAVEDGVDAVVDIATLTGACLRTFGVDIAGVMGNDRGLIDRLRVAGEVTDEPVWELPLHRPYRAQLESSIADLTNMGGVNAGSITAALFLEEFVDGIPWAHVDIAGTAQQPAVRTWRNKGASGFGAKLLIELATGFSAPEGAQRMSEAAAAQETEGVRRVPRLDRAGRQQGAAPGDDLPGPDRGRDRAVRGHVVGGRQRHDRRRRARAHDRLPDRQRRGLDVPLDHAGRPARRPGLRGPPGDHRGQEPAQR